MGRGLGLKGVIVGFLSLVLLLAGVYALAVGIVNPLTLGAWKYALPIWPTGNHGIPGGITELMFKILGGFTMAVGLFGIIGLCCHQARGFIIIHIVLTTIDILLVVAALCAYLYAFISSGSNNVGFRNLSIAMSVAEVILVIDLAAANRCNASLKSRLDRMVSEVSADPGRRKKKRGKGKGRDQDLENVENSHRLQASAVPWTHGEATGVHRAGANTIERDGKAASNLKFDGWDNDVAEPASASASGHFSYLQPGPGSSHVGPAYQQPSMTHLPPQPLSHHGSPHSANFPHDPNQPPQQFATQAEYAQQNGQYADAPLPTPSGTPPGSELARPFSADGYTGYPSGIIPHYASGTPPGPYPPFPFPPPGPHDSYNPHLFGGPGLGWWPGQPGAPSDYSNATSSAMLYPLPTPPGGAYDPHSSLGWWTSQPPHSQHGGTPEGYAQGQLPVTAASVGAAGAQAGSREVTPSPSVRGAKPLPIIPEKLSASEREQQQHDAMLREQQNHQLHQQNLAPPAHSQSRSASPQNSDETVSATSSLANTRGSDDAANFTTDSSRNASPQRATARPNTFGHLDDFRSSLGSEG
ncbi:hypothetical protein HK097_001066, partial [Rhizophlyctis rosea]